MNIDEIPIGGGAPKTFEELLEENLRKMGGGGDNFSSQPLHESLYNREEEEKPAQPKREFLKRKTQKSSAAGVPSKKYNYYVDNFEDSKKREQRSTSQVPEKT